MWTEDIGNTSGPPLRPPVGGALQGISAEIEGAEEDRTVPDSPASICFKNADGVSG